MTRRESATAKEVVKSTDSKIHSHPDVSQVETGMEPATTIESRCPVESLPQLKRQLTLPPLKCFLRWSRESNLRR